MVNALELRFRYWSIRQSNMIVQRYSVLYTIALDKHLRVEEHRWFTLFEQATTSTVRSM